MKQNVTAFQNKYSSIKGMEKIYQYDGDFYYWSRLYKIQSIYIYHDYDCLELEDSTNLKLSLSTADETFSVELLFVKLADFFISDIHGISDFEIDHNNDSAFGNQRLYLVTGDEGHSMSFLCREIEVLHVSQGI